MTFRGSDHPDELLSASLTGDLTAEEQARLDRHLAECPRCRDELDAFTADRQALGSMRTPPAPRDLEARVRAGIEQPGSRRTWFVGLAGSVATVAAAIAVVALIGRLSNEPGSSPSPAPSGSEVASPSDRGADPRAVHPDRLPGPRRPGLLHPQRRRRQPAARLPQRSNRRRDHRAHALGRHPRGLAFTRRAVARLHLAEGRVGRQRGLGAQPHRRLIRPARLQCPVPVHRPPGVVAGQLGAGLHAGVHRSWTASAATPWKPRSGSTDVWLFETDSAIGAAPDRQRRRLRRRPSSRS